MGRSDVRGSFGCLLRAIQAKDMLPNLEIAFFRNCSVPWQGKFGIIAYF